MTTVRGQGQRGCVTPIGAGAAPCGASTHPLQKSRNWGGEAWSRTQPGPPPYPRDPLFGRQRPRSGSCSSPFANLCSVLGALSPPSGPRRRGTSTEPSAGPRRGRAAAVGGLAGSLPAVPAAIQVRLLNGPKSSLLIPQRKGAGAVTALFDQITSFSNLFYLRDEPATQRRAASCSPLPGPDSLRKPG